MSYSHKILNSVNCLVPQANTDTGQCFLKKNITKVAILGDSNGNQMASHLNKLLTKEKCTTVKTETEKRSFSVNTSHFLPDVGVFKSHDRDCQGCGGKVYRCRVGDKHITVDFEANEFLLDTEISTYRIARNISTSCGLPRGTAKGMPCPQSLTTQQFLLKEYFPRTGYPDLIFMFTNSHDIKTQTREETELYASFLGGMMELYVPPSTTVVIFSKPYEDMQLKPDAWKRSFQGKGTLPQIQLMNNAMARGFAKVFSNTRMNVYPFFDLFRLGKLVTKEWAHDGIHKKAEWYLHILRYFTNIFCQH